MHFNVTAINWMYIYGRVCVRDTFRPRRGGARSLSRLETPISVLCPAPAKLNGRAPLAHESTRQRQLDDPLSPLPSSRFSRSIHHCAFSNAYSRVPVLKLGNFFFRFFANLIFLRNLIISKHENLDIWNGRLGKF